MQVTAISFTFDPNYLQKIDFSYWNWGRRSKSTLMYRKICIIYPMMHFSAYVAQLRLVIERSTYYKS